MQQEFQTVCRQYQKQWGYANIQEMLKSCEGSENVTELFRLKIAKYQELLNAYADKLIANESKDFENKKVYMVQLGGRIEGGMTEIHDIAFVIGRVLEEAYPHLIKKWIGTKSTTHIDSSIEIKQIQDYEVALSDKPQNQSVGLFFLNFGSYTKGVFGEVHRYACAVAKDSSEAVLIASKAYKESCPNPYENMEGRHLDDAKYAISNEEVDDAKKIDRIDRFYLSFKKLAKFTPIHVLNDYRPIDMWTYQPEKYCAPKDAAKIEKIKTEWLASLEKLLKAKSQTDV